MLSETFELIIKRPREAVFEALSDAERFTRMAGPQASAKVKVESVPERPRTGLGSAVRVSGDLPGMQDVLVEVVEWSRPSRVVRKLHVKGMPTVIGLGFEDAGNGTTRLRVELEMRAEGMMQKMMLPLLAKKLRDEKPKALAVLQSQLDKHDLA